MLLTSYRFPFRSEKYGDYGYVDIVLSKVLHLVRRHAYKYVYSFSCYGFATALFRWPT